MDLKNQEIDNKNLEKISGGVSEESKATVTILGGEASVWKPTCAKCGKLMFGGKGVVRIDSEDAPHPYFCTECA